MTSWDLYLTCSPVVSSIIVAGWAWYKFSKQQKLSKELQNEKAKLDQQVNLIIEKQKFQYEQKLTNFSLFARKKHSYCIKLFEKLSQARNDTMGLTARVRSVPTFTDYNEDDIQKYLEKFNITNSNFAGH